MEARERRASIIEDLLKHQDALTGTFLAQKYRVSRQVIVQDMALLKAQGVGVISTSEGYLLSHVKKGTCKRAFPVKHGLNEIEDELNTFVDYGGNILSIVVSHPIYGEISADMMIDSRRKVIKFMKKLESTKFVPLMDLTGGEHIHIVEADSEETLDEIEEELKRKGYFLKEHVGTET